MKNSYGKNSSLLFSGYSLKVNKYYYQEFILTVANGYAERKNKLLRMGDLQFMPATVFNANLGITKIGLLVSPLHFTLLLGVSF